MSENLKLKKVNKSFVPELISCFSDSYAYEYSERCMYMYITRVRILVVFLDVDILQYYLASSCKDMGVHTFPVIEPMARMEFELTYYFDKSSELAATPRKLTPFLFGWF